VHSFFLNVELEGDGLGLEVLVERLPAKVLAEPGPLEPAKGGRHVRLVVHIDEAGSGLDVLGDVERLVDVLREHARRQTVLCVVRPGNDALHVPGVELGHDHLGPKLSSFARYMSSSTSQKMVGCM